MYDDLNHSADQTGSVDYRQLQIGSAGGRYPGFFRKNLSILARRVLVPLAGEDHFVTERLVRNRTALEEKRRKWSEISSIYDSST